MPLEHYLYWYGLFFSFFLILFLCHLPVIGLDKTFNSKYGIWWSQLRLVYIVYILETWESNCDGDLFMGIEMAEEYIPFPQNPVRLFYFKEPDSLLNSR